MSETTPIVQARLLSPFNGEVVTVNVPQATLAALLMAGFQEQKEQNEQRDETSKEEKGSRKWQR